MTPEAHHASFVPKLKSAAGFALMAVAIAGVAVSVGGGNPEEARLLLNIVAVIGALAGTLLDQRSNH